LAFFGLVHALYTAGRPDAEMMIISTKIEHPSIMAVLQDLAQRGVQVKYCPVDKTGKLDVSVLMSLLSPQTILLTFSYLNSEIGTIQPVRRIVRAIEAYNREHETNIQTHLDAAQAPLWLSCKLDRLGVNVLTLDAGKCYGPKGAGVLAWRHGSKVAPIILGGGQEMGYRAGTEHTAGIVGASVAICEAQATFTARSDRVSALRDHFITSLLELPGVVLNGDTEDRAANNVNISIAGYDSEFAVVWLDEQGIACSTKSACSGAGSGGSMVVQEVTGDNARATSTIRFSLGEMTTKRDLDKVVRVLRDFLIRIAPSKQQ
ncbi:MAG: aminotransferase class V-fold PLP-dependent enzyme, partial [Bacteroidota bacterium]